MKRIILLFLILAVTTLANGNNGVKLFPSDKDPSGYQIMISPHPESDVIDIKFIVPEESFVRLYVSDDLKDHYEILCEGEFAKGKYCVHYIGKEKLKPDIIECKMDISGSESGKIIQTVYINKAKTRYRIIKIN